MTTSSSSRKRIFVKLGWGVGALLLAVGVYLGALQYWMWKWDSPHTPLPENHLSHQALANVSAGFSELSDKAQQEMTALATELQSVSMSGAMIKEGNVVWAGSVGLANVEQAIPASINTQYRVGSVSKAITAVVLMRMVEEGLIDLDAPIQRYLPDYPRDQGDITARQLASHMAGVRHYQFDITRFPPTDGYSNHKYESSIAALAQFKGDDLLFAPGQGFAYSTHGYTLLSAVMQAAGGKRFETLIDELVALPSGLSSTYAEHLLTSTEHLANFYTSDNGLYGVTPEQNLSNKVAGGGLVSTPTDLVKLGAALLNGGLLQRSTFTEMVTVQPMFDGSENPQSYGLGWRHYETSRIFDENNKVDIIHHGGVSVGANAFLMLLPEHDIAVAILTNGKGQRSRGEIQMLAYRLARMAIEQP